MSSGEVKDIWDVLNTIRDRLGTIGERMATLEESVRGRPRPCPDFLAHLRQHEAESAAQARVSDRWWTVVLRVASAALIAFGGAMLALLLNK
jgi:hypothetical protein